MNRHAKDNGRRNSSFITVNVGIYPIVIPPDCFVVVKRYSVTSPDALRNIRHNGDCEDESAVLQAMLQTRASGESNIGANCKLAYEVLKLN